MASLLVTGAISIARRGTGIISQACHAAKAHQNKKRNTHTTSTPGSPCEYGHPNRTREVLNELGSHIDNVKGGLLIIGPGEIEYETPNGETKKTSAQWGEVCQVLSRRTNNDILHVDVLDTNLNMDHIENPKIMTPATTSSEPPPSEHPLDNNYTYSGVVQARVMHAYGQYAKQEFHLSSMEFPKKIMVSGINKDITTCPLPPKIYGAILCTSVIETACKRHINEPNFHEEQFNVFSNVVQALVPHGHMFMDTASYVAMLPPFTQQHFETYPGYKQAFNQISGHFGGINAKSLSFASQLMRLGHILHRSPAREFTMEKHDVHRILSPVTARLEGGEFKITPLKSREYLKITRE